MWLRHRLRDRFLARGLTIVAAAVMAAAFAPGDTAQAWTLKTLHSFCTETNCADGSGPLAGLVMDSAGNLYGTAQFGGAYDRGVVFQLKRKSGKWAYRVLYHFCAQSGCADGSLPAAALILDTSGRLYGTAETGGVFNCGIVFRLTANARRTKWRISTLHDFCAAGNDGKFPVAGLTYQGAANGSLYDVASPLYGTSSRGGSQDQGAVFALGRPHGKAWRETVVHSFCVRTGCADGEAPLGNLIMDGSGNLYGNTSLGGSKGSGAVFELSPPVMTRKWKETVLYSFCRLSGCADGERPLGALLMDGTGNLFGTTANPGDQGLVYKLVPDGKESQETVLYAFCQQPSCTDGYTPMAGLIPDGAGNLIGTTAFGGTNPVGAGTVFMLSETEHTVLYNFCTSPDCSDGAFPQAPVIMDAAGRLYGTTTGGVGNTRGTVFELEP
jgi:uncharacterized repeat protein (TIGR03803 family)